MVVSKKHKNETKTVVKKKITIVSIICVLIIGLILILLNISSDDDKRKAAEFEPSSEIKKLVTKMRLTDKGKTILYASSPQLKGKVAFNGICGRDGDPNAYVAGCYYDINGEEYIDIYDSGKEATELEKAFYNYENSKIVTLAHEMMHAVYSRVSGNDKDWIEIELNKLYASNSELREEISLYPSSQKYDELYVRVATELYGIPSTLEKHYSDYSKIGNISLNCITITKHN